MGKDLTVPGLDRMRFFVAEFTLERSEGLLRMTASGSD
jgi:hypothetical protein